MHRQLNKSKHMAVHHALQLLQDRPELTATSPQFRELGLRDDQATN
jgi:phage portal protein BeeE